MRHLLFLLVFVFSSSAIAKEHIVKLLTTDSNGKTMVMEPAVLTIAKGDSVKFIPSDPTHNAESVVLPKGAKTFMTPMGQEATITFSEEGAYLYKCTPHFALGMLGVITVGKATNKAELVAKWNTIKSGVAMNKDRVQAYIDSI